jgi:hypothetical protein
LTGIACAFLTLVLCPLGLVGLALGITVWVLAPRDLDAMLAGRMHPDCWRQTWAARELAVPAVFVSLACLLRCTPFFWRPEVGPLLEYPRRP